MISFEEAMREVPFGDKPSILLANGFSQAWSSQIFNYSNILNAASFGGRDREFRNLFNSLNTYDFEIVMEKLISAKKVLINYGGYSELIERIDLDKDVLKNALLNAISLTHPLSPKEISTGQYLVVREFLKRFRSIFSVNYDLLLYWAVNKTNIDGYDYLVDDGFRLCNKWHSAGTKQNLFYLHGGLHIFDSVKGIFKHSSNYDSVPIINKVRDNLVKDEFPLFVSEPTAELKKSKIEHNPYLNKCFSSLGSLEGVIFIHGHSMDESDKHIFYKILESKVSKIFVSIFGDEYSESNRKTLANAQAYFHHKKITVEFYQAETAPIWAENTHY